MKMDRITHVEQIGGPSEAELIRNSFDSLPDDLQELLRRAGQTAAIKIDKARDASLEKKGVNPRQSKLDL